MTVEMNKSPLVRLTPVQEIHMAKPATELYVGQILKTVVVSALTNNQVTINIHGQHFNANSSHPFSPGDLLEVKVISTQGETVLEVLPPGSTSAILQATLLQVLPKQAPATTLLAALHQLMSSSHLPSTLMQQIRNTLNNIPTIQQLPQFLAQAMNQSGLFFESNLATWRQSNKSSAIKGDFKGLCLKLLESLGEHTTDTIKIPLENKNLYLEKDPLPLTGAIPQPLHKDLMADLSELSTTSIKSYLKDQVIQVLARITASQITHLSQDQNAPYALMLDLPVKHAEGIDVIPMLIKYHKAEPMQPSKWSVSLALSLNNLGDIQATVSLWSDFINVKFNAQQDATVQTLKSYQGEMSVALKALGLKLQDWVVQPGLENNHINAENLHLLDLRI